MNVELIRLRMKEGFRPFTIVMSSGNKYPVPHPEFVLVTPRKVVVADEQGATTDLDPLHITGLEDLPTPKNGRAQRRRRG